MTTTLSTLDAALKDDYLPPLREAVNNVNVIFSEISRNEDDIVGRQAVWPVHVKRSTSTASVGELATLPDPDAQGYVQATDKLATIYHTIKVSGPARHLTKNDRGAFLRELEATMRGAEKDVKQDLARQSFSSVVTIGSNDYKGSLTASAATQGTTTTSLVFANADEAELRALFVGERISVINGSNGSVRGNSTITAVNLSSKTVTISPGVNNTVPGDYISRQGNWVAISSPVTFGYEMNGLGYLFSNKPYAGINPTSEPLWQPVTTGSPTTTISEVVFVEAAEAVEIDGSGEAPSLWITSYLQRRKMAQILQAQKRFVNNEVTLRAGWKGLEITTGTLVVDRFCPSTVLYGINTRELVRFVGLDLTWDEDDGRVLLRTANQDAVEARMKAYHNLEATTRNAHVKTTLQVPTF